jgi:hypothetical protein
MSMADAYGLPTEMSFPAGTEIVAWSPCFKVPFVRNTVVVGVALSPTDVLSPLTKVIKPSFVAIPRLVLDIPAYELEAEFHVLTEGPSLE